MLMMVVVVIELEFGLFLKQILFLSLSLIILPLFSNVFLLFHSSNLIYIYIIHFAYRYIHSYTMNIVLNHNWIYTVLVLVLMLVYFAFVLGCCRLLSHSSVLIIIIKGIKFNSIFSHKTTPTKWTIFIIYY